MQGRGFFGGGNGRSEANRTKGECYPHGRNVKDYLYFCEHVPKGRLPDARSVLELNCMSKHVDGISCGRR